jgi:hypothetical protein
MALYIKVVAHCGLILFEKEFLYFGVSLIAITVNVSTPVSVSSFDQRDSQIDAIKQEK